VTVLVTGANGFLGAALVARLVERGERDVRCLVRAGSDRSRLERVWERHPGARVAPTVGSLMSTDAAARALDGVSTVYHLAAALRGPAPDVYLNTVVTSAHLLEAAARRSPPPRLVLVSSFGVYGTATLPAGAVLDETTQLETHPQLRDPYSQAKLRQERLFWEYRERCGAA
jgi:2-alkyl-3-oxoalkanoate reductase